MSHLVDEDTPPRPYALDDLAITTAPGAKPAIGPFGCIILEDGTVHTLTMQHTHGMLLTLLFPEKAKEAGYAPPDEDSSVLEYQMFELDHKRTLPVVRIATGGLLGNYNISKSDEAATTAQIQAVSAYSLGQGIKLNDEVHLDCGEVTLRKALKFLGMTDQEIFNARYGD
jgi:hypothetical protein